MNSRLLAGLNPIPYWRLILMWIGLTLIPTAALTVPLGSWLSSQLDHSVYAGAWAHSFSVSALWQLMVNGAETAPIFQGALMISLLLTLALSPFLTGMIIASASGSQPLEFVALAQGGIRQYGRMFRTLLWSAVPLGIVAAIGAVLLNIVGKRAEIAVLESQVSREHWLVSILLMALLIVAHATVEAGRAQFALDAHRRSAIKAWWRGSRLIFGRPIATLGSYLLITAAGLMLMMLVGIAQVNVPHATVFGFWLSFALTELIAVSIIWMRIARLLTLIQIAR